MHPVKYILIGITRSEKMPRKRFAMLTSQQNVTGMVFMQIRADLIEKSFFLLYLSQYCR